jgi:hypothetical protein
MSFHWPLFFILSLSQQLDVYKNKDNPLFMRQLGNINEIHTNKIKVTELIRLKHSITAKQYVHESIRETAS